MTEVEDWNSLFPAASTKMANQKCVKISYTRDFLLSFNDMEICKRPPKGFDPSFLSDCQEVIQSAPEWRRAYGTSSIQSCKRGESGLQTATWVESSSRGVYDKSAWQGSEKSHGRWENRVGSSEESGDLESEKGSVSQDSSRLHDSQSQQLQQSPERDGLLGSGGFPRPSVHAGGPLRVQRNGQQHLSRSTDRYQPPWMNKPSFQARRDATDLCNDETFGSSERPSEDKADEERRRRASFEMMRKEQQKALQEKLKQAPIKQNTDLSCLDISEDEMCLQSDNGLDRHVGLHQADHVKSSLPQASASRPLVPPGFASTRLDKNLAAKPPMTPAESEHERSMVVELRQSTNGSMLTNDPVVDQIKEKYLAADLEDNNEHLKVEGGSAASVNGIEKPMATLLDTTDDAMTEFAPGKSFEKKSELSYENPTSILEKLFGDAIKANSAGLAAVTESSVVKSDEEPWDPINQSSKFAHWFVEEEVKSSVDQNSSKAEDFLSLFVNNEKGMSQEQKNASTTFSVEVGNVQELPSSPLIKIAGSSAPDALQLDKLDAGSGVLTCEDLEQFILAEANASHASVLPPTQGSLASEDLGTTLQKTDVDDRASQHLLSLLQKGLHLNGHTAPTKVEDTTVVSSALPVSGEGLQLPQKTLTLETLFGTAFMQELQSVEAPVSVQGVSGRGAIRNADDVSDINLVSTRFDELRPAKSSDEISATLYHGLERKPDITNTSWAVLDGWKENTRPNVAAVFRFKDEPADDIAEIHLPEEDSLISIGNPPSTEASKFPLSGIASEKDNLLLPAMPDDIIDKFSVLSNTLKGDGIVMPHTNNQPLQEVLRGPFDMIAPEVQYQQHLFGGQSSLHLNMNPSKPYSQLEHDPNRNQGRFMGNSCLDHQHPFAPNVLPHPFHHGAAMAPRLDHPQHPAIHNMIPSSFPGSHPLAPLPADMPLQHLPGMGVFNNPMASLMPELHSIQRPLFHQRSPHFYPMEMPIPGETSSSVLTKSNFSLLFPHYDLYP